MIGKVSSRSPSTFLGRVSARMKAGLAILALANALVPLVLSYNGYPIRQVVLAMMLFDVCLFPTVHHLFRREQNLPILPVLCLSFAVQYAMPVVFQEPGIELASGFHYLEDGDVQSALALSILGVCLMQLAYYLLITRKPLNALPTVTLNLDKRAAELYCVFAFVTSLVLGRLPSVLSKETYLQFSALINLVQNQVLVAIALLAWIVFSGRGRAWHRVLLYIVVVLAALRGFSTTMMEQMVLPIAVLFMTRWVCTRRIPVTTPVIIVLLFLFLSPVKKDIRRTAGETLQSPPAASGTNRAFDWFSQAATYWGETLQGSRNLSESTTDAAGRADLLHSLAHIYSLTPEEVPYQHGETYSYLAVAWVPRAIWPQKPLANSANNYYALAYDISNEEGIEHSSFGVSLMGEGYINFGVSGLAFSMIFLGAFLALLGHAFGSPSSGSGAHALLIVTFVYFLNGIGSSAEQLFGGNVQSILAGCMLLWIVRSVSRLSGSARAAGPVSSRALQS